MLSTHCRARGALRSLLEGTGTEISFPESSPSPLHHCPGNPRAPSSAHCSRWLQAPISTCSKVMSPWKGPRGLSAPSSPTPDESVQPPQHKLCSAQWGSGGTKDMGKDPFLGSGPAEGTGWAWAMCPAHTRPCHPCWHWGHSVRAALKLPEHSPQEKPLDGDNPATPGEGWECFPFQLPAQRL